jgi:membrane-bound lytic murein transglycosylase D
MRSKRPNWWLGLALWFAQIPRAHAVPASKDAPRADAARPASGKTAPAIAAKAPSSSAPSGPSPTGSNAPAVPGSNGKGAAPSAGASAKGTAAPSAASKTGNVVGPIVKGPAEKSAVPAPPASVAVKPDANDKGVKAKPSPAVSSAAPGAAGARSAAPVRTPARVSGDPRRAVSPGGDAEAVPTPESPELRALRDADRELFRAGGNTSPRAAWPSELPGPLLDPSKPLVRATGAAPSPLLPDAPGTETPRDLSWLQSLALPDMPARWDARVVRYLSYYHDEPRGRSLLQGWIKKSGRYGATIRRVFRDRGLPDDLVWVALIESGFDPAIRSSAGACGLWQFMTDGARAFGLSIDRYIDERYDAERATEAAARYLADLHRRLGNWELALAAYNMGYGALLNAIRKYNTNDFWELTKHEAGIPYETALYVPKIIAVAVAARNPAQFGLDSVRIDPPIVFDPVVIPGGTTTQTIASAAGVPVSTIEQLNPQLRKGRTPPITATSEITAWTVRVPQGKGIAVSRKFAPRPGKDKEATPPEDASSAPETAVASAETSVPDPDPRRPDDPAGHMVGYAPNAVPSATAMLPPIATAAPPAPAAPPAAAEKSKIAPPTTTDEKPVVVHPVDTQRFPGRSRIFYRIAAGDTLPDLAARFGVTFDDLARWNPLDLSARLQEGMTLQVFVKDGADLSKIEHLAEADVRCLPVGSDEFFAHFEALRGRKRTAIVVEEGDTWERLGKRFSLTLGQLERINHRSRSDKLAPKETIVVYAPINKNVAHQAEAALRAPAALGPVVAPNPEDLPNVPEVPDFEASDNGSDPGFGASAQSRRLTP